MRCIFSPQSVTTPTREQEKQLQRVLRYIKGTLHYTLSLHPTNQRAKEKAQSLELLAFSASSWTEACRSTSTAYLTLWGVPLIASCRTSCAYKQADAELDSVRLALALAGHTKSLLQHLDVNQFANQVNISLKTSSLHVELVTGRPLAMQLGLSRRNKHIQLRSEKGQLQLSKVHPEKNLAHSLTHTASDRRMLAKLRVTEAAETLALSTVRGQCLASFGSSSSLFVGRFCCNSRRLLFNCSRSIFSVALLIAWSISSSDVWISRVCVSHCTEAFCSE